MLPFERAEYLDRVARTKQRMAAAGIDVLLVSDPCNMNYLTGYDATSYYVHQMVALALDAEEPLWIGRADGRRLRPLHHLPRAENLRGYPESYIGVADRHPMEFVAADAGRARLGPWAHRGRDGRPFLHRPLLPGARARIFPTREFVDASLLVNWVRIVKSPQEIAYMRQAGVIAEQAMNVAIETIEPGVRQCDVAAAIYEAAVSGTAEFGGDMPEAPWMPSGARPRRRT